MASMLPALLNGGARRGLITRSSQRQNPLYDTLRRTNPTGAGKLFDLIDTYTGAKPVREFVTNRPNATGVDVLRQAGLLTGNKYLDTGLGIGAEIALDPTTYVSGGGSGFSTIAGRAARAANLLDDAPRLFSRAAINAGKADDLTRGVRTWGERIFQKPLGSVGNRAKKVYDNLGFDINKLTDEDLAVRPLVGRREAMRNVLPGTNRPMTLRDVVEASADPSKALDDVTDFLGQSNVQKTLDNPLFKDFNFSIPNPFPKGPRRLLDVSTNVPVIGDLATYGLDNLGDIARFSAAGRAIGKFSDKSLLNTFKPEDQLLAKRITNREALKSVDATKKMSALLRSVDSDLVAMLKDPDNGRYFRAAVEGNEKYLETLLQNSSQVKALKNHRQFDKLVREGKKFFKDYLDESAEAGIRSSSLKDPFGNDYFARNLDRSLYPDLRKAGIKTNDLSMITSDMQARSDEFNIPGGTGLINQISRDLAADSSLREGSNLTDHIMQRVKDAEAVLGPAPAAPTQVQKVVNGKKLFDPATGKPVMETVMQSPKYDKGKAKALANKLLNMDEDALDEGITVFGQNPLQAMEQYGRNRSRAIGRAQEIQNIIAQTAQKGGSGTSIVKQLGKLGMESTFRTPLIQPYRGAKINVVNAINSLHGKGLIDNVKDLGDWTTSTSVQNRLTNINKFYEDNRVQGEFFKFVGALTKNFKVWVLATPRRTNRDWYSGAFSNYITHPVAEDQIAGYAVAKRAIIEQDWEGARNLLEKIPRYQRIKAAGGDVVKAAQDDLALVDIMDSTGKLRDIDPTGKLLDNDPEVFSRYLGGDGKPQTTGFFRAYDSTLGKLFGTANPNVSYPKNSGYGQELFRNVKDYGENLTPFEGGLRGMAGGNFKPASQFSQVKNPLLRASARNAEVTDTINRMGGFYAMLKGGYSPEAAAAAIKEAQIDYSSLTRFERKYLATLFPFWSYQSRVVKWGAKTMARSPAFKNIALRGPMRFGESMEENGDVAPARIQERYGIPVPEDVQKMLAPLIGEPVPGVDIYLSDIDIPFVDSLNTVKPVIDIEDETIYGSNPLVLTKTLSETAKSIGGSMLNPLAKFGVEQLSGQDLFTKTPLDATRRTGATLAGRLGAGSSTQEAIGTFEPAITTILPGLNHPLSMARKISSPKGSSVSTNTMEALTNIGTGVKVERIDDEERVRDMRAKISDFLSQSPDARRMTIPYIPKDKLDNVSQPLLEMFELDKQLQRQQRDLRERRLNNPLLTP